LLEDETFMMNPELALKLTIDIAKGVSNIYDL
jgi:hypothetical protein